MEPTRPSSSKRRSRRLRKKLRIGEFREDGFELDFTFAQPLANDEKVDFIFKFLDEVVEPRDLSFGGGENGYVTRAGRGSATDEDREAVRRWLQNSAMVTRVQVKPLEDAWYGHVASEA